MNNNASRFAGLATFAGFQEGIPELNIAGFNLWNLTRDIPGHPTGSTVSERTLTVFLANSQSLELTNR